MLRYQQKKGKVSFNSLIRPPPNPSGIKPIRGPRTCQTSQPADSPSTLADAADDDQGYRTCSAQQVRNSRKGD